MGDCEFAEGTGALGVHAALGDDFSVEVCVFLDQPGVLDNLGTPDTGRHGVLVVDDGCTALTGDAGVFTDSVVSAWNGWA